MKEFYKRLIIVGVGAVLGKLCVETIKISGIGDRIAFSSQTKEIFQIGAYILIIAICVILLYGFASALPETEKSKKKKLPINKKAS